MDGRPDHWTNNQTYRFTDMTKRYGIADVSDYGSVSKKLQFLNIEQSTYGLIDYLFISATEIILMSSLKLYIHVNCDDMNLPYARYVSIYYF